jgi:predicted acylesterase/phospholipase RssA
MEKTQFTSIVISGGALKTLSSIGCIQCLEEMNLTNKMRNFVGTSAGSIMCLFLVLGYTANEIKQFIIEYVQRDDIARFNLDEVLNLLQSYGMNSGKNIERLVSEIIYKKIGIKDITFLELAKITGKNLVVCVANITKEHEEFWSVDTTPLLNIIKAIRTSCSLPLLFTPVTYEECLYVDGGIYNNFPIDYFKDNKLKDILGINIIGTVQIETNNFVQYMTSLFHTIIKRLTKEHTTDQNKNIVSLQFEDEFWISLVDFKVSLTNDMLSNYISFGYSNMKKLLEDTTNTYP